jgi:hypothetical protein
MTTTANKALVSRYYDEVLTQRNLAAVPNVETFTKLTGMDPEQVARAVRALSLWFIKTSGTFGGLMNVSVVGITDEAREKVRQPDVDRVALGAILRRVRGPGLRVTRTPSGVAAQVYRVQAPGAVVYLRIAEEDHEDLSVDAALLEHLRANGLHVPLVIHVEPFDQTLGRSVLLMGEIPGEPLARCRAEDAARRVARAAGAAVRRTPTRPRSAPPRTARTAVGAGSARPAPTGPAALGPFVGSATPALAPAPAPPRPRRSAPRTAPRSSPGHGRPGPLDGPCLDGPCRRPTVAAWWGSGRPDLLPCQLYIGGSSPVVR